MDGETILRHTQSERSIGCSVCEHLSECGGTFMRVFDCLSLCCGKPNDCQSACPNNPRDFVEKLRDCGGWKPPSDLRVVQSSPEHLPTYITCIQHPYTGFPLPSIPYVAVPTFSFVGGRSDYGPRYETPESLRHAFGIGQNTAVIFLSVDNDPPLERYWRNQEVSRIASALADLKPTYVTAPNFSMVLNVPRPDNILNRNRMLRCCKSLSEAGCSVVPYLCALTPFDWDFWKDFLRSHPEIIVVAKEFQKGDANPERADLWINNFRRMQEGIGRKLHLLAVGARRHVHLLRDLNFSIIDSNPFMKTIKRRALVRIRGSLRWKRFLCTNGALGDLFRWNLARYEELVRRGLTGPSRPIGNRTPVLSELQPQDGQLFLPFQSESNSIPTFF